MEAGKHTENGEAGEHLSFSAPMCVAEKLNARVGGQRIDGNALIEEDEPWRSGKNKASELGFDGRCRVYTSHRGGGVQGGLETSCDAGASGDQRNIK
jgi:hypothetical protein